MEHKQARQVDHAPHGFLQTGQRNCYDMAGEIISCAETGQDGEYRRGLSWPEPRFEAVSDIVLDHLTGLAWTTNANLAEFPLMWQEALEFILGMNRRKTYGFSDWRLPNRRELRSLVSYETRRPALPQGHPFSNIFLGWYWTSTSAAINPAYAWYIHMEGARLFYGRKDQYFLLWPVRGRSTVLPATGQRICYDSAGVELPCGNTGQDGETTMGLTWPSPRFEVLDYSVIDRLTGLRWLRKASLSEEATSWPGSFDLVEQLNGNRAGDGLHWRLPCINELESLVDCSTHSPALPPGHPFTDVKDVYWSSTTSFFETDWAWALYLTKGALGVGIKKEKNFFVWPVSDE